MTDCMKGCVVSFDHDIHEEAAEALANAIKMIKGVQAVTLSEANSDDWMNQERIHRKVRDRLFKMLATNFGGGYEYDLVERPKST